MKKVTPIITEIMQDIISTEKDARKFDRGNSTAGKRVRKRMQLLRSKAKEIRIIIQIERKKRRIERREKRKQEK